MKLVYSPRLKQYGVIVDILEVGTQITNNQEITAYGKKFNAEISLYATELLHLGLKKRIFVIKFANEKCLWFIHESDIQDDPHSSIYETVTIIGEDA